MKIIRERNAAVLLIVACGLLLLGLHVAKGISTDMFRKNKIKRHFIARCIEFVDVAKAVCIYPEDAQIMELSGDDEDTFTNDFLALVLLANGRGIPHTSWMSVSRLSEEKRTAVMLSDGDTMYAFGEGKTFADAMEDLLIHFPSKQDVVPSFNKKDWHADDV